MTRRTRRRGETAGKKHQHRSPALAGGSLTDTSLETLVLALFAERAESLTATEILAALQLVPLQLPELRKTLMRLTERQKLDKKGRHFTLAAPPERLRATLDVTSKGFGFAMIEGEAKGGKDVFIAPHHLGGASHGDTVLIAVTGMQRGRREGRVVQVLSRAVTRLCGIFTATGTGGYLTPDDERLPYTVLIRRGDTQNAADNIAVVADILDYGSERQGPTGRIVEILGDPKSATVQIRMAMLRFGLQETFPAEVLTEAAALGALTDLGDRLDLRAVAHVTIDSETARDFDDAVCVERTEAGYTLYVSIADVSHYVPVGSAIDREAYHRGTSTYLPDRVLPMLPERLSNDLCSLVPDQDRAAFTAILNYDAEGRRIGQRYGRSLIRSHQRFTYTTVHQLTYLRDPEVREAHAELAPMLDHARRLAALLKQRRTERGSLEFNIPEAQVQLDGDRVAEVTLGARNEAHMLVEDFMLAANEAVAESLSRAGRPVLYRIHEYPDLTKLETFTEAARAMGLQLPRAPINPAWFARVLAQAHGTPTEYVVNTLLLRTMQQARYSPENAGHFGLAADYYLHFTSPIRRYPDLVAHRVLQAQLVGEAVDNRRLPFPARESGFVEAGVHLSQCERRAIQVERNVHARLSVLFLFDRVGETFTAIISGVTTFGLFVALEEVFVSGSVPLKTMTDDYYLFDGRRLRLVGEASNRIYQLGQRVEVRLEQADLANRRLTFALLGEASSAAVAGKND